MAPKAKMAKTAMKAVSKAQASSAARGAKATKSVVAAAKNKETSKAKPVLAMKKVVNNVKETAKRAVKGKGKVRALPKKVPDEYEEEVADLNEAAAPTPPATPSEPPSAEKKKPSAALEESPRKRMAEMKMEGLRLSGTVAPAEKVETTEKAKTKVATRGKRTKSKEPIDPVAAELLAKKPKRPCGGAWGVFMEDNRQTIMQNLPEGFKATAITKEGSKQWQALGESEKKEYQKKYEEKLAVFKQAMNAFTMESIEKGMVADVTPVKGLAKVPDMTPVKGFVKPPTVSFNKEVDEKMLDAPTEDALREANGLGYEKAFRILRTRAGILEKKVPEEKLVRALRASGGSAKKAYTALMN